MKHVPFQQILLSSLNHLPSEAPVKKIKNKLDKV